MKNQFQQCLVFALAMSAATMTACSQEPSDTRTVGQLAVEHAGEALIGSGACAALEQLAGDCPASLDWDNHGQYVSCVAKYLSAREKNGDIPEDAMDALVGVAARSDAGMSAQGEGELLGPGGAGATNDEGLAAARDRVCP